MAYRHGHGRKNSVYVKACRCALFLETSAQEDSYERCWLLEMLEAAGGMLWDVVGCRGMLWDVGGMWVGCGRDVGGMLCWDVLGFGLAGGLLDSWKPKLSRSDSDAENYPPSEADG